MGPSAASAPTYQDDGRNDEVDDVVSELKQAMTAFISLAGRGDLSKDDAAGHVHDVFNHIWNKVSGGESEANVQRNNKGPTSGQKSVLEPVEIWEDTATAKRGSEDIAIRGSVTRSRSAVFAGLFDGDTRADTSPEMISSEEGDEESLESLYVDTPTKSSLKSSSTKRPRADSGSTGKRESAKKKKKRVQFK